MGEFKEGTLKSGGSGKQVTNPKQAIAIALSEANAMNQGGMMYNEIMNRPMFQTPQMREGGGIMAGVAPIRGYEEGGLANSLAEEIRGFGDFLRNPEDSISPELFEALKTMTTEEAFTVAGAGTLGTAALTALIQLHPALRKMKGFKPRAKPEPGAKMTADDLAQPPSGKRVMSPKDIEGTTIVPTKTTPTPGRVARAKDAVSSTTSRVTTPIRTTGSVLKGTAKLGAGAAGATAATDLALGTDYLSSGLSGALNAALKAGRITREEYDRLMATPEVSALLESFRDQPTPPEAPTTDVVVTEKTDDDGDGEETKKRGFIDMFRDANERLREFYSDPATQYGLAVAAQPTEGFVPRNALSDFIIGKEQYKTLEADKDTSFISNYNFLKENTDLSDEEILSKLSGEETSLDQFLSIFGPSIASGTVGTEDIDTLLTLFRNKKGGSQPGITIDAEGKEVEQ